MSSCRFLRAQTFIAASFAVFLGAGCGASPSGAGAAPEADAGGNATLSELRDAPPTPVDDANDAGDATTLVTQRMPAHAARSLGFAGKSEDYFPLYNVVCQSAGDCAAPCVTAGGTMTSCATGSDCVASSQDASKHCLPPTYWLEPNPPLPPPGTPAAPSRLLPLHHPFPHAPLATR